MNEFIQHLPAVHINDQQMLERSRWFGPNLISFLATSKETNGAFSLLRCVLQKSFTPPLHVHSREDESYIIVAGEVCYEVGDEIILAKPGDYVHLPKGIPHTFKLLTDAATILLFITPGGFEEMFMKCSRPALTLELPTVEAGKPTVTFFELLNRVNAELGVMILPNL